MEIVNKSTEFQTEERPQASWRDYITITKPRIVMSNLITTFVGTWLALHSPFVDGTMSMFEKFTLAITILLGSALVIAGSCVLNNYIDREFDKQMSRTKNRPSANGTIKPKTLYQYGIVLFIIGTIVLGFAHPLAALLGLLGVYVYVIVYTKWLKRSSTLNTVVGGISGAIPPIIGWAGVTGGLEA
ncbi:MAG: UbiA family prenyltransferase, partial [Bacilli bacterium]